MMYLKYSLCVGVGVGYGIVMPQGSLLCAFIEDRILPAVSQMEAYCETLWPEEEQRDIADS